MLLSLGKFTADLTLLNKLRQAEHEIGYKLAFKNIPDIWIDGLMRCDMTRTWKKFGFKIYKGVNYFTIGAIKNNVSTRFDSTRPQYQSWLGGYLVKLEREQQWTLQDHLNLAVADQTSWLKRYGDTYPFCDFKERNCRIIDDSFELSSTYTGTLYEGTCTTHSDVGEGFVNRRLRLSALVMAGAFNVSNPDLNLPAKVLRPQAENNSYEILELKGYIGIFDIKNNVKVVLYGNGVVTARMDTFEVIKNEILLAMKSCEILRI